MTPRLARIAVVTLGLGMVAAVGCKGAEKGRSSSRTVKASVANFDPNADVAIALDDGGGEGGERPDDWEVQHAFEGAYSGLDACVAAYKDKHGMKPEHQLEGDIDFAVKLNGGGKTKPLGVNASISSKKLDKDNDFKDCMRDAVGNTDFPKYRGPHVVATFATSVDPGSEAE